MGVRIEIEVERKKLKKMKGMVEMRAKIGKEEWRIIGVYVGPGEEARRADGRWRDRGKCDCRGDYNARVGKKGERKEWGKEENYRESKDKKINGEGRVLIEWFEEMSWVIFNGCMEGDREGEWTYTGAQGNSVIDYVMGEEEVRGKIKKLEMEDKIDSQEEC